MPVKVDCVQFLEDPRIRVSMYSKCRERVNRLVSLLDLVSEINQESSVCAIHSLRRNCDRLRGCSSEAAFIGSNPTGPCWASATSAASRSHARTRRWCFAKRKE
jgi:hypothetical protein